METQKKGNGFTLVELIVVITILAILGTIAIMAFEGYSKNARDSARLSDISSMKKALELWILQSGSYPEPTTPTNITYSGAITWTQGTYGATVHQTVGKLDKKPTDPLYDTDYTYSVTTSKKEYQLGAVIEGTIASLPTIHQTYAATESKEAFVSGNYNGVVTSTQTGGIYYILAVPSIILSDINDTDLIGTKQFVLHKKSNLPHSYANKSLTMTGTEVDFNPVVVWSGTGYVKLNNQTEFETLVSNLQAVYNSGSLFASLPEYSNIATTGVYSVPAMNAIKSIVQVNLKQELEDVNVVSQNVVPQNGGSGSTPTDESYFTFDGSGIITDYNVASGGLDVVIPSSIGGVAVTAIGGIAFKNKGITSVIIPDSVTTILSNGSLNGAFRGNSLTSVTIPNSVTSIGIGAFRNNFLTGVTIPNGVTTIGDRAFYFNQLTSVTIPNSVTSIGNEAFRGNSLTSVTIPNSVTTLGNYAFQDNFLTSVTLGTGVTTIGTKVFYNNKFTSVTIPNSVTSIGYGAFGSNLLTSVTIPNSVTTIGDSAFEFNQLTSVTIPNSVTTIGDYAFQKNLLTSVTIGTGVTSIGNYAFRGGDGFGEDHTGNSIESIVIPSSVTTIGDSAFENNRIASITIPSSVTTIGMSAFIYNKLTTLTIPSSVTTIGLYAFGYQTDSIGSGTVHGPASGIVKTTYENISIGTFNAAFDKLKLPNYVSDQP